MLVVNLFGAPGSGKSTSAAYVFSKLKMAGVNAELVTEFAKDKVWEESKEVFNNQVYIFGKQYFRISRVKDKVDVIITDSPILLSGFYNKDPMLGKEFDDLILKIFNNFWNFNVFINRVKPYNPAGRFQTEEESNDVAVELQNYLKERKIECVNCDGDIEGCEKIFKYVMSALDLPIHV